MKKPVIFYFVHAHGNGHRATFNLLYPALSTFFEVIAVTTNNYITSYLKKMHGVQILELPSKYPPGYSIPSHTFSKAFEVTPYETEPAVRAKFLADAIIKYRPKAFYCDGVPELAIMMRSMGVPVVLVHLPGNVMNDPTQVFAYQLADHIVAHFPSLLEQINYPFTYKTYYSGYMSKYVGQISNPTKTLDKRQVTIILGFDNYDEQVLQNMTKDESMQFTIIGNKRDYALGKNCRLVGRVDNVKDELVGNVVISAAGQNTIAELLSLNKRLILLPEPRPYDEQVVHATQLADQQVALLAKVDFTAFEWQHMLQQATTITASYDNLVNRSAPKDIAQKMKHWYG